MRALGAMLSIAVIGSCTPQPPAPNPTGPGPEAFTATPPLTVTPPTTDVPSSAPPSAKACTSSADCASSEMCSGPEGCGAAWTCEPARACTRDLASYCGCDGKTFQGSSSCPPRAFARRGPCDAAGAGGGPSGGKECKSTADCGPKEMCAGPDGCNTPWTCQPSHACTRDLVTFCGCDDKPFHGSSSCPGKPFKKRGFCGTP